MQEANDSCYIRPIAGQAMRCHARAECRFLSNEIIHLGVQLAYELEADVAVSSKGLQAKLRTPS